MNPGCSTAEENSPLHILPQNPAPSPRHRPIGLEDLESPLLADALALWNDKRGDGAIPSRDAFTPRAMSRFLSHAMLVKVIDAGEDFEFRVVGDAMARRYGFSIMGKRLSEIPHPGNTDTRDMYREIVQHGRPLAQRGWVDHAHETLDREVINLPLGTDDEVEYILAIIVFYANRPTCA